MVVDCYVNADFARLLKQENPQDPICSSSSTVFVVTFPNCTLLWVSKIQTKISLSTLHYTYVKLYQYLRGLPPLKSIPGEVIDNLGIDSKKLEFVSRSTVYEDNNRDIVLATIPSTTITSKNIYFKYHWFRDHIRKEF